jgi:ketosteroid isomerase-like protein
MFSDMVAINRPGRAEMRSRLMCVAILALAACTPDSGNIEAEVQQLARSYVTTTDITASVNLLDAGPTVTSITGEGRIVRGRDAIKDEANKQIALLPQLKVTAGAVEVTRLGSTHALAIAPFSIAPSSAPQLATIQGTASLLLAKRDSGWKVVHEHLAIRRPAAPSR